MRQGFSDMLHLGPEAQEQDWGLQDRDEDHHEHNHTYQNNYSDDEEVLSDTNAANIELNIPNGSTEKLKSRGPFRGDKIEQYFRKHKKYPKLTLVDAGGGKKIIDGKHINWLAGQMRFVIRQDVSLTAHSKGKKVWYALSREDRETVLRKVMQFFDAPWTGNSDWWIALNQRASKVYSALRCSLKEHWRKYNPEDAPNHVPECISHRLQDWVELCDFFENNPIHKEQSSTNSQNRSKQEWTHTSGSKPFNKRDLGPFDLFKSTHMHHDEKGNLTTWMNEEAHGAYMRMREKKDMYDLLTAEQGKVPVSEMAVMKEVLGHRPGYTRGMGHNGPKPSSEHIGYGSNDCPPDNRDEEIKILREEIEALKKRDHERERDREQMQRFMMNPWGFMQQCPQIGFGHYPWGNFTGSSNGPSPTQQNIHGGSPSSQMPMAPLQPQPSFAPFYPMFPGSQMFGGSFGGLGADRSDRSNDGNAN